MLKTKRVSEPASSKSGVAGLDLPAVLRYSLVLLWAVSATTAADTIDGTWFLSVDNDTFAQSDDHYTNGVQFGWASGYLNEFREGPVPGFVADGLEYLPLVNRDGRQRFISHSLSHRIFTPNNIETTEPIPNDMPYSGLLFASLTAGAQDARFR